jgi:hypothetical protein
VPWRELPARLAEAAVARVLPAFAADTVEKLWAWEHPLADIERRLAMEKEEAER